MARTHMMAMTMGRRVRVSNDRARLRPQGLENVEPRKPGLGIYES